MKKKRSMISMGICGAAAGAINGLFGAGGGMVLVPLLSAITALDENEIFPASVSIIFPICLVSLLVSAGHTGLPFQQALPYLIGGLVGGILAGITGQRIPVKWLHRILGLLILWGGYQYLC